MTDNPDVLLVVDRVIQAAAGHAKFPDLFSVSDAVSAAEQQLGVTLTNEEVKEAMVLLMDH